MNEPPDPGNTPTDSSTDASVPESSLQGTSPSLSTEKQIAEAVDSAFDYRGDVTVEASDGRCIEGFIYDRQSDGDSPFIRIMPTDGSPRLKIPCNEISALTFSGKDTAFGRGWEAWVKKFKELKAKGEKANIEVEPLD